MRAMILQAPGAPLLLQERADPFPGEGKIRITISACGVCPTDLHVVDGELSGHQGKATKRDIGKLVPGAPRP
jgi:propanol-preferring alcohol dehydrogenase